MGTMASPPRMTVHMSTPLGCFLLYSKRLIPAMPSLSRMGKPIISTSPRAKVSTLKAEGTRSSREISWAAAYSGLIIMFRPISRLRRLASR